MLMLLRGKDSMRGFRLFGLVVLSALLISCDERDASMDVMYKGDEVCKESTRNMFGKKCFPDMKMISRNYALMDGKIYWVRLHESSEVPCYSSSGDMTGIGAMFSPRCWVEERNRVYYTKEYVLRFVASYSPKFRALKTDDPKAPRWQRDQLESYASDNASVYFEGKKIERASPNDFSVIFPFGIEDKWNVFSVSRSNGLLFMEGKLSENVELERFNYFVPVQCPGHELPCTSKKDPEYQFKYLGYDGGVLGWIGKDVVYLRRDGIDVYRGKFSSGTFMFLSVGRTYLFSGEKFYELRQFNQGYSYDKRAYLVDMDFGYFRENSY
ncbi:hypothetical protein ACA097_00940 [Pseudomonas sp. QL9]|uniref:hypothetical protein n=1 Tax=Pseudomonas sp. QL9 TaxID=3242725 RepID=UPI00352B7E7A